MSEGRKLDLSALWLRYQNKKKDIELEHNHSRKSKNISSALLFL